MPFGAGPESMPRECSDVYSQATISSQRAGDGQQGQDLADVMDRILDRGVVADAYAPVSLLGIGLLGISGQHTIRSIDSSSSPPDARTRRDPAGERRRMTAKRKRRSPPGDARRSSR